MAFTPSEQELEAFKVIPEVNGLQAALQDATHSQELKTIVEQGLIPGLLDNRQTDQQYQEEILRYLDSLTRDKITVVKHYIADNKAQLVSSFDSFTVPGLSKLIKRKLNILEKVVKDYEKDLDQKVRQTVKNLFQSPIVSDMVFLGAKNPTRAILHYLNSPNDLSPVLVKSDEKSHKSDPFEVALDNFWNQITPADKSRMLAELTRNEERITSSNIFNKDRLSYLIKKIKTGTTFEALLTGALKEDGGDLSKNLLSDTEAPQLEVEINAYLNKCGLYKRAQIKDFFDTQLMPSGSSELIKSKLKLLKGNNEVALCIKDGVGKSLIECMHNDTETQEDQVFSYMESSRDRDQIEGFLKQNTSKIQYFCEQKQQEFLQNINFENIKEKISYKEALGDYLQGADDLLNLLFKNSEKKISLDGILTIAPDQLTDLNNYLKSNKKILKKVIGESKLDYLINTCKQYQKLNDLKQAQLLNELFNSSNPQEFQLWLLKELNQLSDEERKKLLEYFKKNATKLRAFTTDKNAQNKIDKLQACLLNFDDLKILSDAQDKLSGFVALGTLGTLGTANDLLEKLLAGEEIGIIPYLKSVTQIRELSEYLSKNNDNLKKALPPQSAKHIEKLHTLTKMLEFIENTLDKSEEKRTIFKELLLEHLFSSSEEDFKNEILKFLDNIEEQQRKALVDYLQKNETELLSISKEVMVQLKLGSLQNICLNYSLLQPSKGFPSRSGTSGPLTGGALKLASNQKERVKFFKDLIQIPGVSPLQKQQTMIKAGFSPDGNDFIYLSEADHHKLEELITVVNLLKTPSPAASVPISVELSPIHQNELLARGIVLPIFIFSTKNDEAVISQFRSYLAELDSSQQQKLEQEIKDLNASSGILTEAQKERLSKLSNLLQQAELVNNVTSQVKNLEEYFKKLDLRTQCQNEAQKKAVEVQALEKEVESLIESALQEIQTVSEVGNRFIAELNQKAPTEQKLLNVEAFKALNPEEQKKLIRQYPLQALKDNLAELDEKKKELKEREAEITRYKEDEQEAKKQLPLFGGQTKIIEEKVLELRKLELIDSLIKAIAENKQKINEAEEKYDWGDEESQQKLAQIKNPLQLQNNAFDSLLKKLMSEVQLSAHDDLALRIKQSRAEFTQLDDNNIKLSQQFFQKITELPNVLEKFVIPEDCFLKSYGEEPTLQAPPTGQVKASPKSLIGGAFSSITLSAKAGHELHVQHEGGGHLYFSVQEPQKKPNSNEALRDLAFMLYSQWLKTQNNIVIDAASAEDASMIKEIFKSISKDDPKFNIQSNLEFRGHQPKVLQSTTTSLPKSESFKNFKVKVNTCKENDVNESARLFLVKHCGNPKLKTEIEEILNKDLKLAVLAKLREADDNPYLNVARANYYKQLGADVVKDNQSATDMLEFLKNGRVKPTEAPPELDKLRDALAHQTIWSRLRGN